MSRPAGGVGRQYTAPLFPEAFDFVQRGADVSDGERQDKRSVSEHTLLPETLDRHVGGFTTGARQAARTGAHAQEVRRATVAFFNRYTVCYV